MKEITIEKILTSIISSQPGDGTRYDYCMLVDHDNYYFTPWKSSSIIYPQAINKWSVSRDANYSAKELQKNGMPKDITEIAKRFNSNPWTVAECFRTIQELL